MWSIVLILFIHIYSIQSISVIRSTMSFLKSSSLSSSLSTTFRSCKIKLRTLKPTRSTSRALFLSTVATSPSLNSGFYIKSPLIPVDIPTFSSLYNTNTKVLHKRYISWHRFKYMLMLIVHEICVIKCSEPSKKYVWWNVQNPVLYAYKFFLIDRYDSLYSIIVFIIIIAYIIIAYIIIAYVINIIILLVSSLLFTSSLLLTSS